MASNSDLYAAVVRQVNGLTSERDAMREQIAGLVAERDALRVENERLRTAKAGVDSVPFVDMIEQAALDAAECPA